MLEKIKLNLNLIFLILVIILAFLLGKSCNNKTVFNSSVLDNKTTITSTHKRDTILPKDTVYILKDKPVPYPVYIDSGHYNIKPVDSLELYRFFVYKDSIEDKNIKIYSTIVTQGKTLSSFKPKYKLKVPLTIIDSVKTLRVDSVFITKSSKYQISAGLIASSKMLAPMLDLSINRSTYSVGYDPFNKTPVIGFKYKLIGWNPRRKK